MPYITQKRRKALHGRAKPDNPGDLNYLITDLIGKYCEKWGLSYIIINDVIGALECAKMEFYRRMVGPYEEGRIMDNGDIPFYEDAERERP